MFIFLSIMFVVIEIFKIYFDEPPQFGNVLKCWKNVYRYVEIERCRNILISGLLNSSSSADNDEDAHYSGHGSA